MLEDLAGRVALVTGGATGIGGAISRAYGKARMKVAVHYMAGKDEAEKVARRHSRSGRRGVDAAS